MKCCHLNHAHVGCYPLHDGGILKISLSSFYVREDCDCATDNGALYNLVRAVKESLRPHYTENGAPLYNFSLYFLFFIFTKVVYLPC